MYTPNHNMKNEIMNAIKSGEEDAKIKIQDAINNTLPFVRKILKSDHNLSDEEIEKIMKNAAEEQYKISFAEFNKLFLKALEKIFPPRGK